MQLTRIVSVLTVLATSVSAVEPVDPSRFEKEILVPAARDAIQMEVLADGDIVFGEFWGTVKRWEAKTGVVATLGRVPTKAKGEVGLLGLAVPRDFERSGQFFALFCPETEPGTMRVSRFTVHEGGLSEETLLAWPYDTEHVFHMGGGLWLDGKGDLYIGNGDNCHWNPGLPQDIRPERKNWDAFRSAANSRDLRGKVLRIHPRPEGGYTIPQDNLFPGGKEGRPEIFAMGVRNPFRLSVDDTTGTLYFGDVGPNVLPELGVTPVGYEEINAARTAGNFGWPLFVGPNEALPLYDFATGKQGPKADPNAPVNPSPRNTGIKNLPPAQPALIWYDNLRSDRFPTLGSGGRSLMAGPVYRYDPANPSATKLPEAMDGRLFIYEWMRNWIQTVKLNSLGPEIEPFLPTLSLRRPIDLKIGPDGALYVIEYGDQWWENNDSRIVRIVYRRGNRAPVAKLAASETAGRQPLALTLDGSASRDADGDMLTYAWSIAGKEQAGTDPRLAHTFEQAGSYEVRLTVRDVHGAESVARETIHVGNGRPEVTFEEPAPGSFFDWDTAIPYRVRITESDGDAVVETLASVHGDFRSRPPHGGEEALDPGLALMRGSTCFACHQVASASAGPAYKTVALKYKDDAAAPDRLAKKILGGGAGVWGQVPMPPHPQHTLPQLRQMVGWILSLKDDSASLPVPGVTGRFPAPKKPSAGTRANEGVLVLTAAYTDDGKGGTLPPLRGEGSVVLHSRRKKAALYDENHGMAYIEQVEGEKGILGHFKDGAHILWRGLNLDGIRQLKVRAGSFGSRGGRFELRRGKPEGELLATVNIPPTGEGEFQEINVPLGGAPGLTDFCVVACCEDKDTVLGLNWIEFKN
jgi:cytochrome c